MLETLVKLDAIDKYIFDFDNLFEHHAKTNKSVSMKNVANSRKTIPLAKPQLICYTNTDTSTHLWNKWVIVDSKHFLP